MGYFFGYKILECKRTEMKLKEGEWNCTTISIRVTPDDGLDLDAVVRVQLPNIDECDWLWDPSTSGLRSRLSHAMWCLCRPCHFVVFSCRERDDHQFNPLVPPGKQIKIVFRSFNTNKGIINWLRAWFQVVPFYKLADVLPYVFIFTAMTLLFDKHGMLD